MNATYWLIYEDRHVRECKPFKTQTAMDSYIERNRLYIEVIAKTRVL